MLIAAILFLVLFGGTMIFMLHQIFKKNVTGAVGHLQKLNDELQHQQAEFKQKIADADKEYQAKMARLQQEVAALQSQAKQEASKLLEEAKTRAMQERERLINEAVETREKMRQEIMAEMEERAILHGRFLIAEFFSGELRRTVHQALVREVISGIADVQFEKFQVNGDEAELTSAEALSSEIKQQLQKAFKQKINREIKFKEVVNPELVGGIVLRFGSFVIDGSLTNRLKESAARLKKETARKYQSTT